MGDLCRTLSTGIVPYCDGIMTSLAAVLSVSGFACNVVFKINAFLKIECQCSSLSQATNFDCIG